MRPGPPRDLLLKPLSASSLRLSYDVPSQMREFPAGLVQAVTISSEHQPDTWTSLDTNISREHQKVGISMLLIIIKIPEKAANAMLCCCGYHTLRIYSLTPID